jgi:hypothetical protein
MTPFSAVSLPAAMVAPPAKKLECWNTPFSFWMDIKSGWLPK